MKMTRETLFPVPFPPVRRLRHLACVWDYKALPLLRLMGRQTQKYPAGGEGAANAVKLCSPCRETLVPAPISTTNSLMAPNKMFPHCALVSSLEEGGCACLSAGWLGGFHRRISGEVFGPSGVLSNYLCATGLYLVLHLVGR